MWIGGTVSAGIIIFLAFSYAFSSAFYKRYPVEKVGSSSWFGCEEHMTNTKFSTLIQPSNLAHATEDMMTVATMLIEQQATLIIDLINTAFRCNDSIVMHQVFSNRVIPLEITSCNSSYNESIVSLSSLLPLNTTNVELILPGVRTVGLIRIGLKGPGQTNDDGR